MKGQIEIYKVFEELKIDFEYFEHPPVLTVDEMNAFSKGWNATRCKNLFFRNHKGNKHYLIILRHDRNLVIKDLELKLKQGKLTFASPHRLEKYLKASRGAVSPLELINDSDNHVIVFIDDSLKDAKFLTFHPNSNEASVKLSFNDFIRYLDYTGNVYSFVQLY